MNDFRTREDPVVKALNDGENRYRQTVLSQGPLPGYPIVTRDVEGSESSTVHPSIDVRDVQAINRQRANRWHGGDFRNWSGLEWAGALCGEAGEAANVCKKLRRVELALDGNAKSERPLVPDELVQLLAGECADTFLYLTLLASRYDIDLADAIREKFNKKSMEMGFPERLP